MTEIEELEEEDLNVKIAYWDTEWSPAVSYTWSGFPKYLPNEMLIEDPRLLCYGFKFDGEDTQVVDERVGREEMLLSLWNELDRADMLVSYNGQSFDTPKVNSEFMQIGLPPPSPYKEIDLYRQIKSKAKFYSGKLDFVAERIISARKEETGGFRLWKEVLAGDEAAWGTMRKYQKQDVDLLVELFEEVRPWLRLPHPVEQGDAKCRNCGSHNLERRGYARTLNGTYQRYNCRSCGSWTRGTLRVSAGNMRNIV